jgi:hypothetical protein
VIQIRGRYNPDLLGIFNHTINAPKLEYSFIHDMARRLGGDYRVSVEHVLSV